MAVWSKAPLCKDRAFSSTDSKIHQNFWFVLVFYKIPQTFRANISFSGNFRKIRLPFLARAEHKLLFRLGVMGVLSRALSKN